MAQEMMENHDNRKSCTEDTWSTEYSPLAILPPGDLGRTTYGHSEMCYPQAGMEETVLMLQFFGNADAYLNVEDKNQPLNQSSSIWLEQCTNRSNWSMVRSAEFFAVIFKKMLVYPGDHLREIPKANTPTLPPALFGKYECGWKKCERRNSVLLALSNVNLGFLSLLWFALLCCLWQS